MRSYFLPRLLSFLLIAMPFFARAQNCQLSIQANTNMPVIVKFGPTMLTPVAGYNGLPLPGNCNQWTISFSGSAGPFSKAVFTNETAPGGTTTITNPGTISINGRTIGNTGMQLPVSGNFNIQLFGPSGTPITVKLNMQSSGNNGGGGPDVNPGNGDIQNADLNTYKMGSAVYDAIALASNGNQALKIKILAQYANVDPTQIATAYANNRFLYPLALQLSAGGAPESAFNLQSALSAAGGLNVTDFAVALTDFIVKRTKEELNAAFFVKLKTTLEDPKFNDLRIMFPQTYRSLLLIGDDIYNYNRYLTTLKENFEADLNALPDNFPALVENNEDFFNQYPMLKATLLSGNYMAKSLLINKENPGIMIEHFPAEYFAQQGVNPNFAASISALQLFSVSLKDTASGAEASYWASTAIVRQMLQNDSSFKYYLGLLYQKASTTYASATFKNGMTLASVINKVPVDSYFMYKGFISELTSKTNALNNMLRSYSKASNDSLAVEQYYSYYNASLDILEYSTKALQLPYIHEPLPAGVKNVFTVAQAAGELVVDINRKRYASAVANAVTIYDLVRNRHHDTEVNRLQGIVVSAQRAGNQVEAAQAQANLDKTKNTPAVSQAFFRYGTFMATMLDAKSSDEMQDAIENFALPAGSSRIKRETPFNVSVNAYCGLYGGYERITPNPRNDDFKLNSFGLTAPVGIAISTGKRRFLDIHTKTNPMNHWSYSAFVSLIDLGAIASYRFENDTAQVPEIQLKNILSPGLFLSVGLPKCPISVNLGAQMGANLRSISSAGADYENSIYWRYSLSICVDIPVLNLYTKSN